MTHWDPISITSATPGAEIYYKVDVDYDEAWLLDEEDPAPPQMKWQVVVVVVVIVVVVVKGLGGGIPIGL